MTNLHSPKFSAWASGHLVCRVEEVADRLALTFDDGPSDSATPRILDLLARHGGRATFFTLARNAERHPDLLRRMLDEGHEVALHGDLHWPLPILPPGLIRRELERSAAAVSRATGLRARHYRPPFGLMTPSQARFVAGLGYRSVLGDVYPEDPHRPGTERIVQRVLARLKPGSIVILHDGSPLGEADRSQTVAALDSILRTSHERGWRSVTVAELLAAEPGPVNGVEPSLLAT
jgi:peptidoglycan/xylan/chitin deacetylase (PgdA/CDA1 family)